MAPAAPVWENGVLQSTRSATETLTEYTPVLDAATYFRDLPK